jgi:mono/diheme cytochrome c family protein
MKNQIYEERNNLWWMLVLLFFLFGCNSTPEVKTAQAVSAEAIAGGNVEQGRKLFMGYAHFQNGGPPCMGCHSVDNNGLLGGGVMGPNLTDVTDRLSQDEIASLLSNSGSKISPVMQPIFTEHPLIESEQADLIAFMKASAGRPEVDREWLVVAISLGGFVAATGLLGFFYRNRLRSVRRALVNQAQKELL